MAAPNPKIMDSKHRQGKLLRSGLSVGLLLISLLILYIKLSRMGYIVPISYILDVFCWSNCQDEATNRLHQPLLGNKHLNYDLALKSILGSNIDKNQISLLIEKSNYRLTVYFGLTPVKSYPVVFGNNPVDDKLKEGDLRTPEGIFKIKVLYPHPTWSKFLWIDYPNKSSWRKHTKAKLEAKIGWQDTIGGEVGIHGVPKNSDNLIDDGLNWTWGCISLKNKDIDDLYEFVQKGTEVEIIR